MLRRLGLSSPTLTRDALALLLEWEEEREQDRELAREVARLAAMYPPRVLRGK